MKSTALLVLSFVCAIFFSGCSNSSEQADEYERELKKSYNEMEKQHALLKSNFENQWFHAENSSYYCRDTDSARNRVKRLSAGVMSSLSSLRYKLLSALATGNLPENKNKFVTTDDLSKIRARLIGIRDTLTALGGTNKIPTGGLDTVAMDLEDLKSEFSALKPLTALHRMKLIELAFFRQTENTLLNIWHSCAVHTHGLRNLDIRYTDLSNAKGEKVRADIFLIKTHGIKVVVDGKEIPVENGIATYYLKGKPGSNFFEGYLEEESTITGQKVKFPFRALH